MTAPLRPIPDVACPSVLTSQTPSAPSYNDQRMHATLVCGRCFEAHVMSASHPTGQEHSSSDDLDMMISAVHIATGRLDCQTTPLTVPTVDLQNVKSHPSPQHTTHCTCVTASLPLMSSLSQGAGQCLHKQPIKPKTLHEPPTPIAHCSPTRAMFTARSDVWKAACRRHACMS